MSRFTCIKKDIAWNTVRHNSKIRRESKQEGEVIREGEVIGNRFLGLFG